MLHVTSGSLFLHLGPEQFTAQAGDLIIILPHVIHHGFTGPDEKLTAILDYVNNHFMEPISTLTVSKEFGLTPQAYRQQAAK